MWEGVTIPRVLVLGRVTFSDVRAVLPMGPAVLKLVCGGGGMNRQGMREVVLAFHEPRHCRLFFRSCRGLGMTFDYSLLDLMLEATR